MDPDPDSFWPQMLDPGPYWDQYGSETLLVTVCTNTESHNFVTSTCWRKSNFCEDAETDYRLFSWWCPIETPILLLPTWRFIKTDRMIPFRDPHVSLDSTFNADPIRNIVLTTSLDQVVSFAGSMPLFCPITGAMVSGKQSQGASIGDTSPVSDTMSG